VSGGEFDDGVVFSAASVADGTLGVLESLVSAMTGAVGPWLSEDPDQLHVKQGMLITAAAMMAGRTAGHLQGFGAVNRATVKRLEKTVVLNFRAGKQVGLGEVATAMRDQAQ
jgi:hypothetical protein